MTVPPAEQTCATHSNGRSTVCRRCGGAFCAECSVAPGVCQPCVQAAFSRLPAGHWRTLVTSLVLATMVVHQSTSGLQLIERGRGISGASSFGFDGPLEMLFTSGALAGGVAYLMWLHLTVRRAHAMGLLQSLAPAWAVASCFVPLANLYTPFAALLGVARAFGPATVVRVAAWWATSVASAGVLAVALLSPSSSLWQLLPPRVPLMMASFVSALGATLAASVLHGIDAGFERAKTGPSA